MAAKKEKSIVSALLGHYGQTYADEAGIKLADRPGPLYQLLVVATLLSARLSSGIAIAAARELFKAGYKSPSAMREASWQDRVDALGRGHYRRYDERTATMLGDAASLLAGRWHSDLRRLRDEAGGDASRVAALLREFPGIGPAGADIFLGEVQAAWPQIAPYVDARVLKHAGDLGLPTTPEQLAKLTGSPASLARLTAALVRVSHSRNTAEEIRASAA